MQGAPRYTHHRTHTCTAPIHRPSSCSSARPKSFAPLQHLATFHAPPPMWYAADVYTRWLTYFTGPQPRHAARFRHRQPPRLCAAGAPNRRRARPGRAAGRAVCAHVQRHHRAPGTQRAAVERGAQFLERNHMRPSTRRGMHVQMTHRGLSLNEYTGTVAERALAAHVCAV